MEAGIHKPFDRIAKEFAEEAPLLFLRLLGMIEPGESVELEPLRAETAPPVKMPDYVATLRVSGREPCTLHVEFFVQYRDEVPSKIARYGGSLAWQYQRPVTSVLFLLKPAGTPSQIPELGEFAIGETRLTHGFRTVRLWELDPKPVLEDGSPGLLPWALLMNLGREEALRLGAIVSKAGNEQWIWRFLTLGSLRYDREDLQQMLGGRRMGFVEALLEGSSLVQERVQEAKGEGLAQGLAKGQTEGELKESRRVLRLALARKHPGLEAMPEIDQITATPQLEALLLDQVFGGADRQTVEQAIRIAALNSQ